MLSCNLQGGLGNQMFQIAATNALALRNNDVCGFDFDKCNTPLQGHTSTKYLDNLFYNLKNSNGYHFRHIYNEPKFSYEDIPYGKDLIINGYYQSEKYFKDFKKQTVDLFHLSDVHKKIIKDFFDFYGLQDKPITSVHVRRGDYINLSGYHRVCDIDYFKNAMSVMGDSYFVFLSDDMEWVKQNFNGNNNYVYADFNDEIIDFTLMTMCDNNIISNSSFSWWGAYLNKNENKRVVAPKNWFGPSGPKDTEDLIPEGWVIM